MEKKDIGFLILTFDNNLLNNCITSIRQFYKNEYIYIIDNNINNNEPLIAKTKNIVYYKNNINGFAWSAFWCALKLYKNIKKWIFIHNNYILLDYLPNYVFEDKYVPFFECNVINFSFLMPWLENNCKKLHINFNHNENWNTTNGCLCSIDTDILYQFMDLKLDTIYSRNKVEAVGQEILFGYILDKILKINYTNILQEGQINDYIRGKKKWKYLKYIKGGQGTTNLYNKEIYKEEILSLKNYNLDYNLIKNVFENDDINNIIETKSINDLFIYLLIKVENYDNKYNLKETLCKYYPGYNVNLINFIGNNNNKKKLESILCPTINRCCYGKLYIKDAYYNNYNDIISKKIIIF